MNEYLYEEQLKNKRFEILINTKVELTKEEADFILSWDPTEHENIIYVREGVFLNLNIYQYGYLTISPRIRFYSESLSIK